MAKSKKAKRKERKEAKRAKIAAAAPVKARKKLRITEALLSKFRHSTPANYHPNAPQNKEELFAALKPAPGVLPEGLEASFAMDSNETFNASIATWATTSIGSAWSQGMVFPGYPYLSELAQRPEYRSPAQKLSTHSTRRWIKLQTTGGVKDAKVTALEEDMKKFKVQAMFKGASNLDSFFGRSHLFIDINDSAENPDELKTPLVLNAAKIPKDSLTGFRLVEPLWTYPTSYNSNNPLKADWYDPKTWFVMGQEVHKSRLLTFISQPIPDLLKPSYSFGGLPLIQMLQPYVNWWLSDKNSVSSLLNNFSIMALSSDLSETLADDGDQLFKRAELFNLARSNQGLMMINNGAPGDAEDVKNVAVPLGTLDQLLAQSQEHMCSVVSMPVLIFLGLTPHGLNNSSEEELQVFREWIHAYQEALFTPNLKIVLDILQLNRFGAIDPSITFEWEPLEELSEKEKADRREADMRTDTGYVTGQVLNAVEVRKKLASDPTSPYSGIDINDVPQAPGTEAGPGAAPGEDPDDDPNAPLDPEDTEEGGGSGDPAFPDRRRDPGGRRGGESDPAGGRREPRRLGASARSGDPRGGREDRSDRRDDGGDNVVKLARDAIALARDVWNESDHPRGQPGNAGEFGPGGGGGGGKGGGGKAVEFVSPNTGNLKFAEAVTAVGGKRHAYISSASSDVDKVLGLKANTAPVIGAWADGGENSIMTTLEGASWDQIVASAAMKGHIAAQKQVLAFQVSEDGKQFLANFKAKGNLPEIHDYLVENGLPYHTLEPVDAHAVSVHIFGDNAETITAAQEAGKHYGETTEFQPGRGEFIGTEKQDGTDAEQRADARRIYEELIGKHGGEGVSAKWQGLRDRYAEADKVGDDPQDLAAGVPPDLAAKMAEADKRLHSIPATDKIDTPERRVMRADIASTLYDKDIDKRSRNHEATIILGLPGAGKSTLARPLLDKGALEIDPDNAKKMIPEFGDGIGAYAVHEESSAITRQVLAKALKAGDDIMWPRIDSPDKIVRDVESLKKAGYKVHVRLLDVPMDVAVDSAVKRFLKSGRYVSPEVVKSYGDSPRKAYEIAKKSGLLESADAYERHEGGVRKLPDSGSGGERQGASQAA